VQGLRSEEVPVHPAGQLDSGSGSDGAGVALEDREWPETATRKSLDNSSNDESGSGSETASAGTRESLDSMDDDAQANARSTIVDPGSLPSFSGGSESGEPSEPGTSLWLMWITIRFRMRMKSVRF